MAPYTIYLPQPLYNPMLYLLLALYPKQQVKFLVILILLNSNGNPHPNYQWEIGIVLPSDWWVIRLQKFRLESLFSRPLLVLIGLLTSSPEIWVWDKVLLVRGVSIFLEGIVPGRRNKERAVKQRRESQYKDTWLSWPVLQAAGYLILQYCLRNHMKNLSSVHLGKKLIHQLPIVIE